MLETASPYDDETAEMLSWYKAEIQQRGRSDQLKVA